LQRSVSQPRHREFAASRHPAVERSRIIVVDRDALVSCECYEIIKDTYAQVGG
jgi:hypothetical protein